MAGDELVPVAPRHLLWKLGKLPRMKLVSLYGYYDELLMIIDESEFKSKLWLLMHNLTNDKWYWTSFIQKYYIFIIMVNTDSSTK